MHSRRLRLIIFSITYEHWFFHGDAFIAFLSETVSLVSLMKINLVLCCQQFYHRMVRDDPFSIYTTFFEKPTLQPNTHADILNAWFFFELTFKFDCFLSGLVQHERSSNRNNINPMLWQRKEYCQKIESILIWRISFPIVFITVQFYRQPYNSSPKSEDRCIVLED